MTQEWSCGRKHLFAHAAALVWRPEQTVPVVPGRSNTSRRRRFTCDIGIGLPVLSRIHNIICSFGVNSTWNHESTLVVTGAIYLSQV